MQQLMVSCDWGTSSLRLRLAGIPDAATIAELSTGDGIASTHQRWEAANKENSVSKRSFYLGFLHKCVRDLLFSAGAKNNVSVIVISGMASSSIGFVEIPYATLPFNLDGTGAECKFLEPSDEFPFATYIISGISSGKDVLRGEETQLIGMAEVLKKNGDEEVLCLLPGTHSKHIRIENGSITDFKTYMTGEVFALLSRHSVLSECVSDHGHQDDSCSEAFENGIARSEDPALLNNIFSVRLNYLFGRLPKKENASYLSGLLIGSELRSFQKLCNTQIVLASTNPLFGLYSSGLRKLGLGKQTVFLDPGQFEQVSMKGHLKIISKLN